MVEATKYPEALVGELCAACWGCGYVLARSKHGHVYRTHTRCPNCSGTGLVGGGTTTAGRE